MTKKTFLRAAATLCVLSALPMLTACQSTCTGDARYDNYWCAKGNLKQGVYAAQTNQMRMIAYDRQAELERAKALLAQREAELAAARSGDGATERIASLEAEVVALRQQIQVMMQ